MSSTSPKCPECQCSSTSEVDRQFRLTHEERDAARGQVRHWWLCDHCGHRWETLSLKRWDSVHGASARNPKEYRQRVEKYAKRVYNRVFDYPPGSFKNDLDGFLDLVDEFSGRVGTRYGGRVGSEVIWMFTLRAANKLLERWDDPKNLKYKLLEALNSRRNGAPLHD